jgi:hypothetical protein
MLEGIPTGWPPCDGPEHYHVAGIPAPAPADDISVSGTLLGKVLAARGVKI